MNPDHEKYGRQQGPEHYEAEIRLLKDLLRRLNAHAGQLEEDLETATREIRTLRQRIRSKEAEISNLYASRSWRITRPIRAVSIIARSAAGKIARLVKAEPAKSTGSPGKITRHPVTPGTQTGDRRHLHSRLDIPLTPREKQILDALGRLMEEDRYGR